MASTNRFDLPASLPVPTDDGACDHLQGMKIPSLNLQSTDSTNVNLVTLHGTTVVYCYPRTGQADKPIPEGWDAIPGARGCTPQCCSFRDHSQKLEKLGVTSLFGLSTQDTDYQRELVNRIHLPFPLLSDVDFKLVNGLRLPTFEFGTFGRLVKRLTLIIENGIIVKVFYPVFPPDESAKSVIEFLESGKGLTTLKEIN